MKDKLVKHHRNVRYFRMRKILIFGCIALLCASIVAIPLGITIAQMHV